MKFDIRLLLGGVGLLLFSMAIFEETIKILGGYKLVHIIQRYTKTAWMSVFTGTWITSLLQSSGLVSILLIGFVGAGVMELTSAIGVMIGANIGTTTTAVLIAWLGFGEFSVTAFALPIVAIAGIAMIFIKNKTLVQWAKLLVAFGLLFISISYMKDSVGALQASFDLTQYAHISLWGFGLLGLVVTGMIQSSSTVTYMTLAALGTGIIDFPSSVAIVMGANIGTTFTAVLASFGGRPVKRQVALAQVLFNVIGSGIGVVFFWQYIRITNTLLGLADTPVIGLAILNFIFNASTALLFVPFLHSFTGLVKRIIPSTQNSLVSLSIDNIDLTTQHINDEAAIVALQTDCQTLIRECILYNIRIWGIDWNTLESNTFHFHTVLKRSFDNDAHRSHYEDIHLLGDKLLLFCDALSVSMPDNTADSVLYKQVLIDVLGSIKQTKNIRHSIIMLRAVDGMYSYLQEQYMNHIAFFYGHLIGIISRKFTTQNLTELVDNMHDMETLYQTSIKHLQNMPRDQMIPELDFASIINLSNALHDSQDKIFHAVSIIYLDEKDRALLEKVV